MHLTCTWRRAGTRLLYSSGCPFHHRARAHERYCYSCFQGPWHYFRLSLEYGLPQFAALCASSILRSSYVNYGESYPIHPLLGVSRVCSQDAA